MNRRTLLARMATAPAALAVAAVGARPTFAWSEWCDTDPPVVLRYEGHTIKVKFYARTQREISAIARSREAEIHGSFLTASASTDYKIDVLVDGVLRVTRVAPGATLTVVKLTDLGL